MRIVLGMIFAALALGVVVPVTLAQTDELVVIETQLGTITIELFDEDAPLHVENFRTLASSGNYDSTLFHRIIPGFMIQGGDPNTIEGDPSTWGQGGPSGSVPAEFNDIRHERGIVSMARSSDPDSAGSQFFIVHEPSSFLDESYTVFGRIVTTESFDTLDAIAALDTGASDRPIETESARIIRAYTTPRSEAGPLLEQDDVLRISPPPESETTPPITPTPPETPPSTPETTPPIISPTPNLVDGVYTNKDLGISLVQPVGWTTVEPNKTQPFIPDVAMIYITENATPATIGLNIQYVGQRDIDTFVSEKIEEVYRPAIDAGNLVIDSNEHAVVSGKDAVVVNATGVINRGGTDIDLTFQEIVFEIDDKFYAFTYTNLTEDFDARMGDFETTIDSFTTSTAPMSDITSTSTPPPEGGGCLIATAAYGTEMAHEIQMLREIRDTTLMNTALGSAFMTEFNNVYYTFSPTVADWERQSPELRSVVRALITPMMTTLSIMSLADTESDTLPVLLGALVIALNMGIYIAAPTASMWYLKRRHASKITHTP